jgi:CRISPR-associated protein Cas2
VVRKPRKNADAVSTYIVSYDVCDPKRLRRVFKTMKGWGLHVQYSVFQCALNPQSLTELQSELEDIIDHFADQVLFINVGPQDGRAKTAITSLGKPYSFPVREPVIV